MHADDPAADETGVDLDPSYREAFEFLQSETRVDILLVLAENMRSTVPEAPPGLSFSTLRKRVGVRDSGRFNYHLGQLEGSLVERSDRGYELTVAGMQAVSTLVAGAFASGESRGPAPIDYRCPTCGDRLVASYDSGTLTVVCDTDDDHVTARDLVPPGAAEDRTLEELVEVLRISSYHDVGESLQGVCPQCRGPFAWTTRIEADTDADADADHPSTTCIGKCDRCAAVYHADPGMVALFDPDVAAFFHGHGVDIRDRHVWRLGDVGADDTTVISEDPPRVAVTLRTDGDAIRAVVDGDAEVVETTRLDG